MNQTLRITHTLRERAALNTQTYLAKVIMCLAETFQYDLFQKEIKTNCVKKGRCITEAHIVVRGVIAKQREPDSFGNGKGMPLINITSVLYARFLKPQR